MLVERERLYNVFWREKKSRFESELQLLLDCTEEARDSTSVNYRIWWTLNTFNHGENIDFQWFIEITWNRISIMSPLSKHLSLMRLYVLFVGSVFRSTRKAKIWANFFFEKYRKYIQPSEAVFCKRETITCLQYVSESVQPKIYTAQRQMKSDQRLTAGSNQQKQSHIIDRKWYLKIAS